MATTPELLSTAMRHHQAGDLAAAEQLYLQILAIDPDHAAVLNNLASVWKSQGKVAEAIAGYQEALRRQPDFPEACSNLGSALRDERRLPEAIEYYKRSLELAPDVAATYQNMGNALFDQGDEEGAIGCYLRVLQLKPDLADTYGSLATVLQNRGHPAEAIDCFRRALELTPQSSSLCCGYAHQLQQACQWNDLPATSQRVIELVATGEAKGAVSPFHFLSLNAPATTAEQQHACARQWADHHYQGITGAGRQSRGPQDRTQSSRITVGYLSADFHAHATAYLMAELFEQHDRNRFTINAYSYGPDDGSPMRSRLVGAFDRFVDLREASHAEAAERISADGVDILVDLKGYTRDARTQIPALRPAPVQVNYLGYPGTMGARFIDYILVDEYVVPLADQAWFTEKLVHLPGCYQVNDSRREISPHTQPRSAYGLPEAGFVFCSFNNSYKLSPDVFSVWMELLKEIPGSVLWLLEGSACMAANLRQEAVRQRVDAQRLIFAPKVSNLADHLARFRAADLFLDTLPYNAHTTASDSLWAGCPVLTSAGTTFPSRVAGSLLRTIGLPELITTSLVEYRELALRLARDGVLLTELRARLLANRTTSPLFDGAAFARNIEQAFATMWEIHCAGQEPRSFAVRR